MEFENESHRKAVGSSIRVARQALGMTQVTFGQTLGVHSMTVSQWERGERMPSLESMWRISETTAKPMQWFFWGAERTGDTE